MDSVPLENDMKSHIHKPEDDARKIVVEEFADYKIRLTNSMTAAFMLAANEALSIGPKRMCLLLDVLAEYLEYFSEYSSDGVGFEILEKRLNERGLLEIYQMITRS